MNMNRAVFHLLDGRIHCGASMVTKSLVRELQAAGVDARLICLYPGPVADAARTEGLPVAVLPEGSLLARLNGLIRLLREARDASGGVPVLHSHQLRANRFATLAAWRTRSPHVISVHTHKEEFLRDQFPNPLKRMLMRAIHYGTLRHADARVAVSPGVLRQLRARGYPESSTRLIRNVTLLPEPAANFAGSRHRLVTELGLPDEAFVLMTAGRLVPIKQFHVLLQALARMTGRLERVVLLLAGEGELRGELERLAASLGVTPRVRFLGWCAALEPYIQACDCAVSSSRSECSPVFLIEAMALARPVVAAAAEDVAALIADGVHGTLFPIGDVSGLVAAVDALVANPQQGRARGQEARAHVLKLFDRDRAVRDMLALYATLGCTPTRPEGTA